MTISLIVDPLFVKSTERLSNRLKSNNFSINSKFWVSLMRAIILFEYSF
jgi:hypothetical protein